jgi:hypothetical protein
MFRAHIDGCQRSFELRSKAHGRLAHALGNCRYDDAGTNMLFAHCCNPIGKPTMRVTHQL